MRILAVLLLMLAIALSGCLSGESAADDEPAPEEPVGEEDPEDTPWEDRGEYLFDPATGLCHAKEGTYTEVSPGVYESGIGGGTWLFTETNDVPGLQYENNHPLAGQSGGIFDLPVESDCVGGDQTTV